MKIKHLLPVTLMGLGLAQPLQSLAADKTWNVQTGEFTNPANWSGGLPGPTDIAIINNGGTSTIPATANITFGTIRLGSTEGSAESGHVIMNGGTLVIGADPGDPKAVIGFSTTLSTFIMNGGTIYFDGPDQGGGSTSFKGVNELDWEVGERGLGRFEMYGDSKFYASDDLKVAENALGNGHVVIAGNAFLAAGSGISVSGGGASSEQTMVIGGNARVDSGNSMGAGNPLGGTDEGYLTMAFGGSTGKLTIQDNGILNIRRLSAREGNSTIIVKDRGQFHIFDVLNGAGTNAATRPPETGPNSTFVSGNPGTGTFTLQDDAVMTVNSAPGGGPVQGLAIAGPRDSGNPGGTARFIIRDRASFRVEQDLGLGNGFNATTSDGTLEVRGPNANISIGGNLNMAVNTEGEVVGMDADQNQAPGKATLEAVITGASHSAVNVSGAARIANGRLKVRLDGFTPAAGASYTLIRGGTIEGEFASTDFSDAALATGLNWQVQYTTDSVVLRVAGQATGPRTHVVTTANNVNPPTGSLSLAQAMAQLQNGDTIAFNIPGTGPHFLLTPPGGYPLITADNVLIDGYSQPGSSPNTNPILAANNARIGIVLDSRNGNFRLMDFAGDSPNDQTGYGDTEAATIGILTATNVTVRGFSILSVPLVPNGSPGGDVGVYGISFAKGAQGHINGNWIGVAPDGTTVAGPADAITGFRYRVRNENNQVQRDILINDVIIGVKARSTNAPAEFNVITGIPAIPIIIEGNATRISGNFLNVYPSGVRDFNPPLVNPDFFSGTFEGNIEIGRGGNNTLIGVDGDGVNDEHERNVLSGAVPRSLGGYTHNIEFYGQSPGTNIVIAGNYVGIGVDGTTRFTNGIPVLNAGGGSAQYRFGSDFNGVSDALEGNVVYNNWPHDLYERTGNEGFFDQLDANGILSARGNTLVNNFPFPTSPIRMVGENTFWTAYSTKALADASQGVVPILSATSTRSRLIGTVPISNANYPTTMIDVYSADPEGLEYGVIADVPELADGYIQGRTYLGSFTVDSAADLNAATGQFEFDISSLNASGKITITANYSRSPAGTTNAIILTSPFAVPVDLGTGGGTGATLSIRREGANSLRLSWTGGTGPFLVQRKSSFSDANWMNVLTTAENTALVPNDGTTGFFRVMNSATTTVTPMSIVLGGAFEKPNAVNTPATGRGTISLEGNTLAFDIKYSGLTANANNMHIHGFGTTADAVGVIRDLKEFNTPATLGTQGRIAGSVTLTEEQKTRLLAGDTYVNIHSTANTPGEIRGQITPSILRATLNGANERPAIDSPATGTGTFTLVGDELFMDVSYTGLRGAISNAHIHGPADVNTSAGVLVGGVYPDLHVGPVAGSTAGRFLGRLTLTPAQINAVIDGLSYFNIHSAFAGGGEIRGQIVP